MADRSWSRRALLAGGAAAVAALAGCSALSPDGDGTDSATETPLDRIVVRSDTGNVEPLRLTLVYAPPEGNTRRPVWTTIDAPADGDPVTAVRGLDTEAGVYSLTAASARHANHEVVSFNSLAETDADPTQFEVVVKHTGDVWANRADAGDSISIPGYSQ